MPDRAKAAVAIMRHLVTHDGDKGHGYTQGSNRWGNNTKESVTVDGLKYIFQGGDRDCSSACISAWAAAGVDCGGATYTADMVRCMLATGNFVKKPPSFIASPGDLYLNERDHVAMCLQQVPDQMMEFLINENGQIMGGKEGDQTGRESAITPYRDFPWDCILHYTGKAGGVATGKWIEDSKGWWYRRADGTWPKSQWLELDAWYWFDANGYAACNDWRKINGKWYFFGSDCRMDCASSVVWKGKTYLLDRTGAMMDDVDFDSSGAVIF